MVVVAPSDACGGAGRELRVLFRHLQETAAKAFPKDSMVRYTSVSGLLFLRFFCPAVLSPKLFDLVSGTPRRDARAVMLTEHIGSLHAVSIPYLLVGLQSTRTTARGAR